MYMQFIYLFMYFLSFFYFAVVQLLCVIVCRASVTKDVYIKCLLLVQLLVAKIQAFQCGR